MWLWAHLSYFPLVNTWETGLKYAWGHLGSSAAGWGSRTCENYEVIYFLSEDVAMAAESPGWPWNEHPHEMDGRAVWVLHEVREWLRNGVRNGWVIGCVLWSYLNGPELCWHWPHVGQHPGPVQAHYGTGSIRHMPVLFRPIMPCLLGWEWYVRIEVPWVSSHEWYKKIDWSLFPNKGCIHGIVYRHTLYTNCKACKHKLGTFLISNTWVITIFLT